MDYEFMVKLLVFGLAMNIVGGIRYKLLGGKTESVLLVLMWINVGMFIYAAYFFSFSIVLFLVMVALNSYYYRLYIKIKKKN